MRIEKEIRERYANIEWALNEKLRRLFAANEAKVFGHGGITLAQKATGVARNSIKQGIKELANKEKGIVSSSPIRVRKVGGGRKASVKKDKKLVAALESLIEPTTSGRSGISFTFRNDHLKMTTCDHRILTTLLIISLLRGDTSALFLPRFSAPPIARGR